MIDINKRMFMTETRWDKTIKSISLKIDSPSIYRYTAQNETFYMITNAYSINNNYCIVEVSNVLKN